jgi:hypothetical protein
MRSFLSAMALVACVGCTLTKAYPRIAKGTDVALPVPAFDAADLARILTCKDDSSSAKGNGKVAPARPTCSGYGRDSSTTTKDPSTPTYKHP